MRSFNHPVLGLACVQSQRSTGSPVNLPWLRVRPSGESRRTLCGCGTHSSSSSSSSSPFLCLLRVNGETIGSPPEGWPVFAACVFVLHQMFTQNTPVPLRTRSAHPSNLPCRQRHRVPPGQHLTQSDPLATGEVASPAWAHWSWWKRHVIADWQTSAKMAQTRENGSWMMHSRRTGALPGLPECAEVYFRCFSSLHDQNYPVKGVNQQTCEDFTSFLWRFRFITFCVLLFLDNQNVAALRVDATQVNRLCGHSCLLFCPSVAAGACLFCQGGAIFNSPWEVESVSGCRWIYFLFII